jgi:hypothetical protein
MERFILLNLLNIYDFSDYFCWTSEIAEKAVSYGTVLLKSSLNKVVILLVKHQKDNPCRIFLQKIWGREA